MIAVQAVAVYEPIVTSNYDAGNSRLAPTVTVVMVCLYAPVFTRLSLRACPYALALVRTSYNIVCPFFNIRSSRYAASHVCDDCRFFALDSAGASIEKV